MKAPSTPGGFVDPTNWADEFSTFDDASRRNLAPAPAGSSGRALEAGNLSALEDDQTAGATATDDLLRDTDVEEEANTASAAASSGRLSMPGSGRGLSAQAQLEPEPSSGGGKGIAIAVLLALVVFAGAWFGHLIPHH